jgi:hypothetical protein
MAADTAHANLIFVDDHAGPASVCEAVDSSLGGRMQREQHAVLQSPLVERMRPSAQTSCELYIGGVCVRGSGKFYYEVKLLAVPELCASGWVMRAFHTTAYATLGADPQGDSYAFHAPHANYLHRGVQVIPTPLDASDARGGRGARVHVGAGGKSVVGVSLDLENGEIMYFINGTPVGIAFSGIDSSVALYPAILIARNTQVEVNFGKPKWAYPPTLPSKKVAPVASFGSSSSTPAVDPTPTNGWVPLEHPLITGSSWLARYRYSSAVTALMFRRAQLPETVIREALKNEVTLVAAPMRFQVTCTLAGEGTPPAVLSYDWFAR